MKQLTEQEYEQLCKDFYRQGAEKTLEAVKNMFKSIKSNTKKRDDGSVPMIDSVVVILDTVDLNSILPD